MMIKTRKIYIILSILVTSFYCHSQSKNSKALFKNIKNAISDINTVTYKIDRIEKNFAL